MWPVNFSFDQLVEDVELTDLCIPGSPKASHNRQHIIREANALATRDPNRGSLHQSAISKWFYKKKIRASRGGFHLGDELTSAVYRSHVFRIPVLTAVVIPIPSLIFLALTFVVDSDPFVLVLGQFVPASDGKLPQHLDRLIDELSMDGVFQPIIGREEYFKRFVASCVHEIVEITGIDIVTIGGSEIWLGEEEFEDFRPGVIGTDCHNDEELIFLISEKVACILSQGIGHVA